MSIRQHWQTPLARATSGEITCLKKQIHDAESCFITHHIEHEEKLAKCLEIKDGTRCRVHGDSDEH